MRIGRLALFALAACLGAAVVLLPAVAGSETGPTVQAVNEAGGIYGETHRWSPMTATVNGGGTVTVMNNTTVEHGVEWKSGPEVPACASTVPVGAGHSGTSWSGSCTFTQPGTYTFWCTVHGEAMKGSIVVNPNGTTTMTTTGTAPASSTPGTASSGGSTTQTPGASSPQLAAGTSGSLLAGAASEALKLASRQRGASVRGTVAVSQAGAGARLEVDLLTRSASLASVRHAAQVRVGKLVRAHLTAGRTSFVVPLSSGRARRALRRHRSLRLSVKVIITPLSGSATTMIRSVVVRP